MTRARSLCIAIVVAAAALPVSAEQPGLVVGTKESPPFSFRDDTGQWRGVAIELWASVAERLGLSYELREAELDELIDGVGAGTLDAAVAAVTVTASREEIVDFSHPYFNAGLGIAVGRQGRAGWLGVVEAVFSPAFLKVLAVLALVLLLAASLVWLFERRRNPDQFGGPAHRGIGAAFWWAAVTMTTVGYGDKAPKTFGGRAVTVVWMFASLLIASSFIAAISSALTVTHLTTTVTGPDELSRRQSGAIAGTTGEAYLRERRLSHSVYDTPLEALEALLRGEVDAVVYDRPILRYLIHTTFPRRLEVLPHVLEPAEYAFAFPEGSPLREPVNRQILEITAEPDWRKRLGEYLGE